MRYLNSNLKLLAVGLATILVVAPGCSLFATRPTQELSDTAAALRAAKEVQADILAPDLYRQASETFQKARRAYRLKDFAPAEEFLKKSRILAEHAEFAAVMGGATRAESNPDDPYQEIPDHSAGPTIQPKKAARPAPQDPVPQNLPAPIPVESYDQRMQEEKAAQAKQEQEAKDFQKQNPAFKGYPDPPQVVIPSYGPTSSANTSTNTSTTTQ